jgi:coproporphyrinogen III oxidase-like Fe-S oxidoreductase
MSPAKTTDAKRFLERFCALYQQHDRSIRDWRVTPHVSGLLLELDLDRGIVPVLVHPLGRSQSYAETASLALSIHNEGDTPLPGNAETVLQGFLHVLRQADKGHLELAAGSLGTETDMGTLPALDTARVARAHTRLADEVHWGAFLAYKSLITEDLYPHVGPLGELVSETEIHAGWRDTVQRIKDGHAPSRLGLYIHIPFCAVACTFCFCGKTDEFNRSGMDTYMDQLVAEAEGLAPIFEGSTFTSVYFGGGTPSLLSPPAMRRMFEALYRCFHVPKGTQVIYEGNPDSLNDQKIGILANEGRVTRLTIGVQTLDDAVQNEVRRFNKPEHVRDAVAAARAHGINHVNCDLMAGLPKQTLESFQQDLRFLVSLQPDSVHLNGFRPLPRTRLAQEGDGMSPERVVLRDEMLAWAENALSEEGFASHMGQGPRRTRSAANIQEYDLRRQNSSLLGIGFVARAHSFGGHYYMPDAAEGFDKALGRELGGERRWRAIPADSAEEQHKYLVSNLRTGFARSEFDALFAVDPISVAPEAFQDLVDLGIIHVTDTEIHCRAENAADDLLYRTFFYSPAMMKRARAVWGPDYNRTEDYEARLRTLVESCG